MCWCIDALHDGAPCLASRLDRCGAGTLWCLGITEAGCLHPGAMGSRTPPTVEARQKRPMGRPPGPGWKERARSSPGVQLIQLHLVRRWGVAPPRRWGGAPPRPDCRGCHCAQPSGWCIDTLGRGAAALLLEEEATGGNKRQGVALPRRWGGAPTSPRLQGMSLCSAFVLVH